MNNYTPTRRKSGPASLGLAGLFWKHVTPLGINDCWLWNGAVHPKTGYASIGTPQGRYLAHRVSYMLHYGEIPNGFMVCHKCDMRHCVNPNHLFLGKAKDNTADMDSKGRRGYSGNPGEKHPGAKITETDVSEIRRLYAQGIGQREIGKRFGITKTNVSEIVRRKTWKHIT